MPHNFPRAGLEKMLSIIGCALAQLVILKSAMLFRPDGPNDVKCVLLRTIKR